MKVSLDGGGFNLPPTKKAHSQKAPTAEAEEEGTHTGGALGSKHKDEAACL